MVVLKIGTKLFKISSGGKSFGCGSHLKKWSKVLFCKRLLFGTYISLNINIKIFKNIILPAVFVGVKFGRSH